MSNIMSLHPSQNPRHLVLIWGVKTVKNCCENILQTTRIKKSVFNGISVSNLEKISMCAAEALALRMPDAIALEFLWWLPLLATFKTFPRGHTLYSYRVPHGTLSHGTIPPATHYILTVYHMALSPMEHFHAATHYIPTVYHMALSHMMKKTNIQAWNVLLFCARFAVCVPSICI